MPDRSGEPPSRTKRPSPRRSPHVDRTRSSPPRNGAGGLRDRLKRDQFLFVLCLGALAFMTWAFALTWWVTSAPVPLALALLSVAPAFGLFYLRDA